MSKYKILKELINDWIDREKENFDEARKSAGVNCAGAAMALGAIDAYKQVLSDIDELEQEASITD